MLPVQIVPCGGEWFMSNTDPLIWLLPRTEGPFSGLMLDDTPIFFDVERDRVWVSYVVYPQ